MLKTVGEEEVQKQPEGLQDGGHVFVRCSNCDAILMDIWRTRPHETETWKVKATCCFCGDTSFVQEIKGGFHPGGYGVPKDDEPESDFPSTKIIDIQYEGDVIKFVTKKATPDAKPIKR